jgi:hypothetical protein
MTPKPKRPEWLHEPPADGVMRHVFVHHLPHYAESLCCGFVQVACTTPAGKCQACGTRLSTWRPWFPDEVYEYAVILEDYHGRPPSELRERYFQATVEDNAFQYWCATSPPQFGPTAEWKPVSILLFRAIFEVLLDQFLWRVMHAQVAPSDYAKEYATFLIDRTRGLAERLGSLYKFVTGNKWSNDLKRLGFSDIDDLLLRAARTRNAFLHENPHAGHQDQGLAQEVRDSVARLLELFARLANEYYHPRAKALCGVQVVKEDLRAAERGPGPPQIKPGTRRPTPEP